MKKLSLLVALAFSLSAAHTFAADKGKGTKEMKCKAGKDCCHKMSKVSAMEKVRCTKMCNDRKVAWAAFVQMW